MSDKAALAAVYAEITRDNEELRQRFLAMFPTLTAAELDDLGGPDMRDQWRAERRALAMRFGGEERYPAFQFEDGRPRPVVARVLATLPQAMSAWQVAFWFVSSNSWLGGAAPVSIIDTDLESVVCAAERERDEVAG